MFVGKQATFSILAARASAFWVWALMGSVLESPRCLAAVFTHDFEVFALAISHFLNSGKPRNMAFASQNKESDESEAKPKSSTFGRQKKDTLGHIGGFPLDVNQKSFFLKFVLH